MRRYYIEGFGFSADESRAIIALYNGILWDAAHQPDSFRDELARAVQERAAELEDDEAMVDEGVVVGSAYDALEEIDRAASLCGQELLTKIAALTEDQAREIHAYAIGFWEGEGTAARRT
jgi:hypothetical protein